MKKYPVVDSRDALDGILEALRHAGVDWVKAMLVADKKLHDLCVFLIDEENKIVDGFKPNINADTFTQLYTNVVASRDWLVAELVENLDVFQEGVMPEDLEVRKLGKRDIKRILKKPTRPKPTGRKGAISLSTAREVFLQAHMRCMFKGCAKRLDEHSVIGEKGYFGYLAHIIPASENGPRGNEARLGECERLVDESTNIMLLCDECHRLVDRVAVSDFPRATLDGMRREFLSSAARCLKHLAFIQAPVAEFLWPIGTDPVGIPSSKEIQECFYPLGLRWDGDTRQIADRNSNLHDTKTREFWNIAPSLLELAKNKLEALVVEYPITGLFAGGPMPALIALGALAGNKTKIIPMLNARSSGGWCWSSEEPGGLRFSVSGLDELQGSSEIVLQFNLTYKTPQQEEMRQKLETEYDCQSIIVEAHEMSNECIDHHQDALDFQNEMTKMLSHLKSSLGIRRVHVLPCASNLVCVHFGRSIEQYCPELRVYDFLNSEDGTTAMYPVLDISPGNEGVTISSVTE